MIKAILFDFWGTVVENGTYSPLRQSYDILRPRMAFGQFVQLFEKAFMTSAFKEQAEGFQAVCDAFGVQPKPFIIEKLIGTWNKNRMFAKLYPETIPVLGELKKKYKLALVSNCDSFTPQVVERLELDKFFDCMMFSFEIGKLKTDPELYAATLKKLGVKKNEALVVGDSLETDVAGANAAGISAVLVDRNGKREFDKKIQTIKELPVFLEGLK
ncbi:MAG: HAD family hydrolase [Candidatus Aenigmarchaeota archaeon]|nr:HAD family hydrolase [Candidatus Aenigmarchaeota archaeon]